MLVLQTDPEGKEIPYLERGINLDECEGPQGQLIKTVYAPKKPDKVLVQVEIFGDEMITAPHAYRDFEERFEEIPDEVNSGLWATVILDGATELEYASRKQAEYVDKKGWKDHKTFYASSSHDVEQVVKQCARLRCNVGVAAHLSAKYDEVKGFEVHGPDLPGQFRGRVGAGFTELYIAHAQGATKKEPERYWLQTRADASYAAASVMLRAPDPCEPTFEALWANYKPLTGKPKTAPADPAGSTGGAKED
jgi:hypothetical protein